MSLDLEEQGVHPATCCTDLPPGPPGPQLGAPPAGVCLLKLNGNAQWLFDFDLIDLHGLVHDSYTS